MPKNKQNKGIPRQEVTYTEIKFSRSQWKQRIPKTNQSKVMSSEQQVTYMELKRHKSSHLQLREKRKDRQSSAWQVITGSLGVLCVVLMTTVGILLANLFSRKGEQNGKTSFNSTLSSTNDHWIGFRNSYHLFKESKTWPESYAACKELNSRLMKIHIKEELKLLTLFGMEGWIDLKMNKTDGPLLWQDGTQMNQSLLKFPGKKNHRCAYVSGIYIYSDNCSSGKSYISFGFLGFQPSSVIQRSSFPANAPRAFPAATVKHHFSWQPLDSDCCSCPEKWIGYRCSCYFISNERKTWAESRNSCASQNSSLLWLKNRDELDFFKSNELFYWIGLSYNETRGAWVWEDGSALSQDLFSVSQLSNPEQCILYHQSGETLSEKCEAKNRYICKQQPI
ncbi:killer cell lectin-like receptor subfamily I member 1 [Trichechus inunguis]